MTCPRLIGEGRPSGSTISVSGLTPQTGAMLYSTTKAALIMMTRSWARELGPHRIRVNALAPGLIQTEFSSWLWSDEARRREFAGDQVLPHLGQPSEVGAAALFSSMAKIK